MNAKNLHFGNLTQTDRFAACPSFTACPMTVPRVSQASPRPRWDVEKIENRAFSGFLSRNFTVFKKFAPHCATGSFPGFQRSIGKPPRQGKCIILLQEWEDVSYGGQIADGHLNTFFQSSRTTRRAAEPRKNPLAYAGGSGLGGREAVALTACGLLQIFAN